MGRWTALLTALAIAGGCASQRAAAPPAAPDAAAVERHTAAAAEALRAKIAAYARLHAVLRRLVLALPDRPETTVGSPGFSIVDPSPASVRLFGAPPPGAGVFVASVDGGGPAAGRLEPGDWLRLGGDRERSAVTGRPLPLVVVRDGVERAVAVVPEPWGVSLDVVLLPDDEPNAFATRDLVAVTRGLLALTESEDEVAAIVAHELAHLTLGHVAGGSRAERLLWRATAGVLLPIGLVPGVGTVMGGFVHGIRNRLGRANERAADRLGVCYAAAAGYRPEAALVVLQRIEAVSPRRPVLGGFFDTHPPYAERRATVAAALAELSPPPARLSASGGGGS
jgi:Zn-dependent protease with chaperone function